MHVSSMLQLSGLPYFPRPDHLAEDAIAFAVRIASLGKNPGWMGAGTIALGLLSVGIKSNPFCVDVV